MKRRTGHIDLYVFLSVLALMMFSVGVVYSASVSISGLRHGGDVNYLFRNHAIRVALGLVALFAGMFINYHVYKKVSKYLLLLGLLLLAYTLIGGVTVKGAQRWVAFGPLSFQPSEFAKFALVIHLSVLLSQKQRPGFSDDLSLRPYCTVFSVPQWRSCSGSYCGHMLARRVGGCQPAL